MDRLLIDHEWYYTLGTQSLLESDYREQLIANAASLFPGFTVVRFSSPLKLEGFGSYAPDFLLLENQLRTWWIVEAEMRRHSFTSHIEPQIAGLSHVKLSETDAIAIAKKAPAALDHDQLKALILTVQPNVLVVVDQEAGEWGRLLSGYEATLIVVEPYQSRHGKFAFRQSGEIPGIGTTFLSRVTIRREITRALVIENRSALRVEQGASIELFIDGAPTTWRCHYMAGTMMMFYLGGRFPFEQASGHFQLVQLPNDSLAIEKLSTRVFRG